MKKIFIVEDDGEIRENLEILLDAEGYEVISAGNGLEALEKLETIIPDLILSDIMMPQLDGVEFFRKVKENDKTKTIPFIFLTAKNDYISLRQGMNLGADDYISKPFATDDLLRAINVRLEIHKTINKQIEEMRDSISKYVPHELRTPLVAIMGYTQIILSENDTIEKKEIMEMVDRINYAAKRLYNRIEKFIQLSELGLPKVNPNPDENNICKIDNDLIKEISYCHHIIRERESLIESKLEPAIVKLSSRLLNILLSEVLENAVKFSNQDSPIIISGKKNEKFYFLEVKDFGIGMDDSQVKRIAPFRQFDRQIYQQEGNGLGLVTIKKILEQINGELRIESSKNSYTNIIVKLPLEIKIDKNH